MENPLNKLNPALIGQSNPYNGYGVPTQYPVYQGSTVTSSPVVNTNLNQATKASAQSNYPKFDFNTEVANSLARAKALESSQTAPKVVTPTISEQYGVTNTPNEYDTFLANQITSYPNSQPIDENKIYQDTLQRFQKEIDATNQIYAQKLARQKEVTRGNLGTTTAIAARGGALGSPFGEAQYKNTEKESIDAENMVLAEQQAALSAIIGKGRAEAAKEIADKRAAKEAGVKEYLSFLKDAQTRRTEKLSTLAKALVAKGVNVSNLGQKELSQIAKSYGVSTDEVLSSYVDASKANLEKLSEGQTLVDPKTGKVIYQAPKTYKPSTGGGGGLTPYQTFQGTVTVGSKVDKLNQASKEVLNRSILAQQALARYKSGETKDLNATSQVIITNFNKILDPTSVVRESEYARSPEGQSYLGQIEGKLQQISQGGAGLTEKSLEEFVALGNTFAKNAQNSIEAEKQRAVNFAKTYGLNTDYIGGGYVPEIPGGAMNPEDDALLASVGL